MINKTVFNYRFWIILVYLSSNIFGAWTNWSYTGDLDGVEFWVRFNRETNRSKGQFRVINNNNYEVYVAIQNKKYQLVDGSIEGRSSEGVYLKPNKTYTFISDSYCNGIIDQVLFDKVVRSTEKTGKDNFDINDIVGDDDGGDIWHNDDNSDLPNNSRDINSNTIVTEYNNLIETYNFYIKQNNYDAAQGLVPRITELTNQYFPENKASWKSSTNSLNQNNSNSSDKNYINCSASLSELQNIMNDLINYLNTRGADANWMQKVLAISNWTARHQNEISNYNSACNDKLNKLMNYYASNILNYTNNLQQQLDKISIVEDRKSKSPIQFAPPTMTQSFNKSTTSKKQNGKFSSGKLNTDSHKGIIPPHKPIKK